MNVIPPGDSELDLNGLPIGTVVVVGRGNECDVQVESDEVSSEHFQITINPEGCFIRDLQSRSGTTLNAVPVKGSQRLFPDDRVAIPTVEFRVILPECHSGATLTAQEISVKTDDGRYLLRNINMQLRPGEFVGLVGLSGCGKSTLMRTMTGAIRQNSGTILLNRQQVNDNILKRRTCFLPQEVIIHRRLSVANLLYHAGKIFHGTSGTPEQIIRLCGLDGRENQPVSTLSGGQQKRAGLAQELLFQPDLLCLDEVTSGLDPDSEQQLMLLFRQLCDAGKTILCITHNPERLELCDRLLVMQDGRIRVAGSPAEVRKHFNVDTLAAIYPYLRDKYTEKLEEPTKPSVPTESPPAMPTDNQEGCNSFLPLLLRQISIVSRSPGELLYMLAQGALIGLLIGWCFGRSPEGLEEGLFWQSRVVFALLLAAVWIGATGSVRSIVKDRIIIAHEGRHGLNPFSLLAAVFTVLIVPAIITVMLLLAIVKIITGLNFEWLSLGGVLVLTTACSSAMGLLLSSWSNTQEKALTLLPVLIIGLVIFSGGINELSGCKDSISQLCFYTRNAFAAAKASLPDLASKEITDACSNGIVTLIIHSTIFLSVAAWGLHRIIRRGR